MSPKKCKCCGAIFQPRPQVPNQAYCSLQLCQRIRRQRWNQEKMRSDRDYRENQKRTQRKWMDSNPDYWRQYREKKKNSQHSKSPIPNQKEIAKSDGSISFKVIKAGVYRIKPVQTIDRDENGAWLVEITPIRAKCICNNDACKDRTC